MPHEDDDLKMEIDFFKKQLQASLARNNLLEQENQELRREIICLKSQVTSLKAHNNERKSILWKKLQNPVDKPSDQSPTSEIWTHIPEAGARKLEPTRLLNNIFSPSKPNSGASLFLKEVKENKTLQLQTGVPPPAPPPPPSRSLVGSRTIRRVPEVPELYRLVTKRDAQKDSRGNLSGLSAAAFTKNMIGEIENRSAHLSAIKSDVETQGEFIKFLIKEVETAAHTEISRVEEFVKWLDGELSSLVDERAVLKHFPEWPERKADAMREAAFTYRDLKNLQSEVSSFHDNSKEPINLVLRRAQALQDRLEETINNLVRTRESNTKKYKEFQIPWEWMMDTGPIGQMKLTSLRLAKEYMKRITKELQSKQCSQDENILLQGVRFAYRVHQFAGGFDGEATLAFEELRKIVMGGQRKNALILT